MIGIFYFIGPRYLSKYGQDKPGCGASYPTACFTLSYLLETSYNGTHIGAIGIITDKNLPFTGPLIVSTSKIVVQRH